MNKKISLTLKIQNREGEVFDAEVKYHGSKREWILEFISPITKKLSFNEGDVFECLTQLRLELAKYGCKPLCAGARIDVYPSGMARDMGNGLSAEVSSSEPMNEHERLQYVDIFDYAEPDLIASVEEQLNYHAAQFSYSYELMIQNYNGSIFEGTISGNAFLDRNKVKFTSTVTQDIYMSGENEFECLIDLRKKLEKYEYVPLCNGARFDAYPLPDDLRIYNGSYLHILTPGKVPKEEDRVETFEYAKPDLITSIAEQKKKYESWLDSIKSARISEYDRFQWNSYYQLYFRLIKIGDLPSMWLFDLDPSALFNLDSEINQFMKNDEDKKYIKALSPLSPEQVEQIGSLRGEAIIGFINGPLVSIEHLHSNRVFKDFTQKVIADEAPKDSELQAAASAKREGRLYIIDNRVAELEREVTSSEDILGVFEIKDGQIVPNSYQPNENYLIFGNNGLMQLPASLHEALINALLSLSD
jgi:hypothetical protein